MQDACVNELEILKCDLPTGAGTCLASYFSSPVAGSLMPPSSVGCLFLLLDKPPPYVCHRLDVLTSAHVQKAVCPPACLSALPACPSSVYACMCSVMWAWVFVGSRASAFKMGSVTCGCCRQYFVVAALCTKTSNVLTIIETINVIRTRVIFAYVPAN